MVLNRIRDYLSEQRDRIINEWKLFNKATANETIPDEYATDEDLRRYYKAHRNLKTESHNTDEYAHNFAQTHDSFKLRDTLKDEPFVLYRNLSPTEIPSTRLPAPGITQLPFRYHSEQVITSDEHVPETGFDLHPLVRFLVYRKYPRYIRYVETYCRPLGTTDATFSDFNREQLPTAPLEPTRKKQVLSLVHFFLGTKRFRPLHWLDSYFTKLPLHTGTGYFYRHDYNIRTHAAYAHNSEYEKRPNSKGYILNSFAEWSRTIVHRIKCTGYPFDPTNLSETTIMSKLRTFFLEHPTMLFTRNHISDRDGKLKQRPVYSMDDLFQRLESCVTFPAHVIARKMSSCIMYSLETIRGGMHYIDNLASRSNYYGQQHMSFFSIDWSQYDQRLPRVITDLFWTEFLESLIVISDGYAPTREYPTYPDLTTDALFTRISNILWFLHTWFNNLVYITADGFAYVRNYCGVPSGLFNTQYLDSFGNLFLIIDALIEFGFTNTDILGITFFIMGDDNVGLTPFTIVLLNKFITFFESYSLTRYNMVLSKTKSVITTMRTRIEALGYTCNAGWPTRPVAKLVAQLCYPERGLQEKYMSARSIGMAYAACGMDPIFHRFCEDMYYTFLPYAAPLNSETQIAILRHLPGQFKLSDSYFEDLSLESFPSIRDVRSKISRWSGELDYAPKWNTAHFSVDPDHLPTEVLTLLEYRELNGIKRRPVPTLF